MEGVAIIGMTGRFPGAAGVDQFWHNLRHGVESLTHFDDEELRRAGVDPALLANPGYVKAGRVLDRIDEFDAGFFGYGPREAAIMDPQQRLFLQGATAALETAGHDPDRFSGTIGVYAGMGLNGYVLHNIVPAYGPSAVIEDLTTTIGSDKDFLTTRASYHLGLTGPSLVVQSGCSSSLVAVALAFQSLMGYQCDMALAGGVAVHVPQTRGYLYVPEGILSPDGSCRPFDAKAGGTSFGSGLGIVVLKRLSDAIADGDTIRAVIRGAAINNDGSRKVGYTAPGVESQAEVIAMAQGVADVEPREITYIEAHGTGTQLGDPVEVAALTEAFGTAPRDVPCGLGSVKSNIGHLDTASGVAGLIKTVLALEHALIPPTVHFETPNPLLKLEQSPFVVSAEPAEWVTGGMPRRAGVNSFGIGGTNVHVVVEEAPASTPTSESFGRQLMVLSAQTEEALSEMASDLSAYLAEHEEEELADVAHTLQLGRRTFEYRRAVSCRDRQEAIQRLELPQTSRSRIDPESPLDRGVVFLFPGQGAQHVDMGRALYEAEPVFRQHVDAGCDRLARDADFDLRDVLFPVAGEEESATEQLRQTSVAQPALFIVEYALARLWIEWGVRPRAMVGHSVGEFVAAAIADVFRVEDALELVTLRGHLVQKAEPGAMIAVPLSAEELVPRLGTDLAIAAINTSGLCSVSGPSGAVDRLESELVAEGQPCQRLQVSHAFHSPMMEPAVAPFAREVERVRRRPPEIRFASTVTGAWVTDQQAVDPQHWARQLTDTVRFSDALRTVLDDGARLLLEVGPGTTLTTFAGGEVERETERLAVASLPHPQDPRSDVELLQNALGTLWVSGVAIDWSAVHRDERRRRIALPTYPFARDRHWIEPRAQPVASGELQAGREGPAGATERCRLYAPSWRRSAPLAEPDSPTRARWLVLADAEGLWDPLVEALRVRGDVVVVRPCDRFERVSSDEFKIDPTETDSYAKLAEELGVEEVPEHVVHLWLATPEPLGPGDAFERGLFALDRLVDAISRSDPAFHLTVVTVDAQDVTADQVSPEKATVFGAVRVLPQERPEATVRSVDVDLQSGREGEDAPVVGGERIDRVVAEIVAPDFHSEVAYRRGHRWIPCFESLTLPESEDVTPLREEGVYLITGGLGGIGLTLADHLACEVRARLVLTSRRGLPPEEEWDEVLESGAEAAAHRGDVIRRVRDLEARGAEVLVLAADVTDRTAMRGVVEAARERFGALNGVIHAAGVAGEGHFRSAEEGLSGAAMVAKVDGTRVLEEVCGEDPDFFLLCSSVASAVGGLGGADYCAGNVFLDTFAAQRREGGRGPRVVSIGWDRWAEVGMALADVPAVLKERQQEFLRGGLTREEGISIFRRVLASPHSHVLVSTTPLGARVEEARGGAPASLPAEATASRRGGADSGRGRSDLSRQAGGSAGDAIDGEGVEATVTGLWQQLLGQERAGRDDSFFDQGGNSLLATQLMARVRMHYGETEISLRSFFDRPTIAGLVGLIEASDCAEAEPERAVREQLVQVAAPEDRQRVLAAHLTREISELLELPQNVGAEEIDAALRETVVAAHLATVLERDLELTLYPVEIRRESTVAALARLVDTELARELASTDLAEGVGVRRADEVGVAQTRKEKVDSASLGVAKETSVEKGEVAFILSAPRSGSTLQRLMLSAHSGLFCPPELYLLDHETMRAWKADPFSEFHADGLVHAIASREGVDFEEGQAIVSQLVDRDVPVSEVYSRLLGGDGGLLVDKTPKYSLELETLRRAERLFDRPRYLFLTRHPYAMIESWVRNRFDRMYDVEGEPYALAEEVWLRVHRNLLAFRGELDAHRFGTFRFEDLVREPEVVLRKQCDLFGIDFEEAMLDPYGKGRMFGGPGDPKLFERGAIDPALGEAWRGVVLPRALGSESVRLAASFGYDLTSS